MTAPAPPVHYVAHGSSLMFPCYRDALRACLDVNGQYIPEKSFPRRHTSLTQVTCRACWRQIQGLAEMALDPPAGGAPSCLHRLTPYTEEGTRYRWRCQECGRKLLIASGIKVSA